jgi:hypothetical protein
LSWLRIGADGELLLSRDKILGFISRELSGQHKILHGKITLLFNKKLADEKLFLPASMDL